jgi:hypothetical protein
MQRMIPGDTIRDALVFPCPFCGKKAYVAAEPLSVGHLEPPCEMFVKMEPDVYLRAVNDAERRKN